MKTVRASQNDLVHVTKTITFTGGAGAGAVGTVTVFTISGRVLLEQMTVFCTSDLTEAAPTATVSLGATGNVAALVASTNAVNIDQNEWWTLGAGATGLGTSIIDGTSNIGPAAISANIIVTVGTQNVTGGVLVFDAWYRPITSDGALS